MSIYDKASLVLIPSGTKTSKVYSQKPTNGDGDFTFSRSTAATRVNASGNIEKETSNLLLQSNTFDTTWVKVNTTLTSGQAGYDGTNDAWLVDKSAASARIEQYVSASGVQTLSAYAKAGSLNWTRLNVDTDWAYYDLANGVVGTATGSNIIDHSIEDAGGGWYRCVLVVNRSITTARIYPADADNNSGGTSGNIYIQDAQLEQGLVARSYNETTTSAFEGGITDNVPRLDYTDSSCPALLLEPQRTNLVNHSEYFGDSSWSKTSAGGGSNAVVTDNYGVSPEGLQNAARLQLNLNGGTSASDISYIAYYYAATGVATTNSVYMKSLSGTTNVRIRCGSTFESVDVTTDWQRFDVTDSSTSDRFQVLIYGGINSDTADLLIWGAQGEAGSYATSYIPTYGSAVTRNVDSCSKTGVSSLIGQTEGTFYWEGSLEENPSGANMQFGLSDGTTSQQIKFVISSSSTYVAAEVKNGGVQQFYNNHNIDAKANRKYAIAYKANDFAFYIDGTQIATDTSGSVPACTKISFDNGIGANNINGLFNNVMLFKTRLSNAELADLTTL